MNEHESHRNTGPLHHFVGHITPYWIALTSVLVGVSLVLALAIIPRFYGSSITADLADTDGDGISDNSEATGWAVLNGDRYITDPHNSDTDGDGLNDGEEAGSQVRADDTGVIFTGLSNPLLGDSDGDQLIDSVEVHGWSNATGEHFSSDPMKTDTDDDGVDDLTEAGEQNSNGTYASVSNPQKPDSDDDGLNDATEIFGWKSADKGKKFNTDPMKNDTDGDLLWDGEEAGKLISEDALQLGAQPVYLGFSHPLRSDSDNDGLTDIDEANQRTDPYIADTDRDNIDDGREVNVVGSSPLAADSDDDGFADGYEEDNREPDGFDPIFFETGTDADKYAEELSEGDEDGAQSGSIAAIAGELLGPTIGAVPAIAQVWRSARALSNFIRSRIDGKQFSRFAVLFPYAKQIDWALESLKVLAKVSKLVEEHPTDRPKAARIISTQDFIPTDVQLRASERIWKKWGSFLSEGASPEGLLRLQASGRINLDELAGAMSRDHYAHGAASEFLDDAQSARAKLVDSLSQEGVPAQTAVRVTAQHCEHGCAEYRNVLDIVVGDDAHQAKVGFVVFSDRVRAQIDSEAALIEEGTIDQIYWHFYPSSHSGQLGGSTELFDYLDGGGINYAIHAPVS